MKLNEIKKLNKKQLVERYPFIQLRDYKGDLCYYDEDDEWNKAGEPIIVLLDNGWRDLLLCLCEKIKNEYDKITITERENFYIVECKEKYGTLRIYPSFYCNDVINTYIWMAEYLSGYICQKCGKLTTSSNGKKLFSWRYKEPYISFFCKECSRRIFANRVGQLGQKLQKKYGKTKSPINNYWKDNVIKESAGWKINVKHFANGEDYIIEQDCHDLFKELI